MRAVYVINGLGRGGAELNLVRLAAGLGRAGVDAEILALAGGAPDVLEEARVRGVRVGVGWFALVRALARTPPDLVEGWMYVGALAANLFRPRRIPVTWNFRHVPGALATESWTTRLALRALSRLSPPRRIVVNSRAAEAAHRALGIAGEYRVVHNGVDTRAFRRDDAARAAVRTRLGIDAATWVLLHVARFHPHKGHDMLLEAFARLPAARPACLVCAGDGHETVLVHARQRGLEPPRVLALRATADLVPLYNAADAVVSPSLTESFPTVVAEGMSCERPCIVTDVGESAHIVGDTGSVVPPGDVDALGAALAAFAASSAAERAAAGVAARARVLERFSEEVALDAYQSHLAEVVGGRH
jgi:glycosyltransferase involved in cell wall biosynthesis